MQGPQSNNPGNQGLGLNDIQLKPFKAVQNEGGLPQFGHNNPINSNNYQGDNNIGQQQNSNKLNQSTYSNRSNNSSPPPKQNRIPQDESDNINRFNSQGGGNRIPRLTDTNPRMNAANNINNGQYDGSSQYNSNMTHSDYNIEGQRKPKNNAMIELQKYQPKERSRAPVQIKTIESVNSVSPATLSNIDMFSSIYTNKLSEADSVVELDYFSKLDMVLVEKQYNSAQSCFTCKTDNAYQFFTLDQNNNQSSNPIFVARQTQKLFEECCCTYDCKSADISLFGAKSMEMTISEDELANIQKKFKCVCLSCCSYSYNVEIKGKEGVPIQIGKITKTSCHYFGKYEVRDDLNELIFIIKVPYKNLCMIQSCNCHNVRRMEFHVRDKYKRHLTSIVHEKQSMTLLFPAKLSKKQKALFFATALTLAQTYI